MLGEEGCQGGHCCLVIRPHEYPVPSGTARTVDIRLEVIDEHHRARIHAETVRDMVEHLGVRLAKPDLAAHHHRIEQIERKPLTPHVSDLGEVVRADRGL